MTWLGGICKAYSRPTGTKRNICEADSGVEATKVYLSSPLKPSWINVEFGGGCGIPPAGAITWGSSVGIAGGLDDSLDVGDGRTEEGCTMMLDET
jgi:hypothetical protein